MRKNYIHIVLSLIIILATVTPDVYADGKKGEKEKKADKEKSEKVVTGINAAFDLELKFENWMIDAGEFAGPEIFYEEDLMLESWMTESKAFIFEIEVLDKKMEFEEWMIEEFEIEELEMAMDFEDWMLRPFVSDSKESFTEEEMVLENWMLKF